MGVSDVDYRGAEFSAPDSALEVWLKVVTDAIDDVPDPPDWHVSFVTTGTSKPRSSSGTGSCLILIGTLSTKGRRLTLLDVFREAMTRLDALGDPLTAKALNSVGVTSEGSMFTGDDVRGVVRDTAKTFVALVAGDPMHHIG